MQSAKTSLVMTTPLHPIQVHAMVSFCGQVSESEAIQAVPEYLVLLPAANFSSLTTDACRCALLVKE